MELSIWVIYNEPTDNPGNWVARRWAIGPNGERDTGEFLVAPANARGLMMIRDELARKGLTYMPRYKADDPKIFECWI